ncbi:MAG: hypothetical protein ACYDAY_02795 [Candidatus Dormibacteria bacterium]
MARPWQWRPGGATLQVRDALYKCLEDEQVALSLVSPQPEAIAILALAQRAAGDLAGLLAGHSEVVLDRVVEPERSIRDTLQHAVEVEESYRANVEYALARADTDPVLFPPERRPRVDRAEVEGAASAVIARLLRARGDTDALLMRDRSEAQMQRAAIWAGHQVDVRFRLHRFASHLVEHTIQCDKALVLMGEPPSESRRIVRAIWATRGAHERFTAKGRLGDMDRTQEARLRDAGLL